MRIDNGIVLVADRVVNHKKAALSNVDYELTEDLYFEQIFSTIKLISNNVYHYHSPKEFIDTIHKHTDDIVISLWSGKKSRNRKTLIPSICEAYNICYVGADTYTQILCQDKTLSKEFCKKLGMPTPDYILMRSEEDLKGLYALEPPLVVKPNLEGGSIGISKDNLVYSHEKASKLARTLFKIYKQPILIEKFICGQEVSINMFGSRSGILLYEIIEINLSQYNIDLSKTLYGYEYKKNSDYEESKLITDNFTAIEKSIAEDIFNTLDKVEMLRIDGRVNDSGFFMIELSPDIHLGENATFAKAFAMKGISYKEMLYQLINNSIDNHQYQNASTK